MFSGEELKDFIAKATWAAVNDYEARMLCERTGADARVTLEVAPQGRDRDAWRGRVRCVWEQGGNACAAEGGAVGGPTGCGDAFRAGGVVRAFADAGPFRCTIRARGKT